MTGNHIAAGWDISSVIMYVLLGLQASVSIYFVQKNYDIRRGRVPMLNRHYLLLIIIWDIVASFRYVGKGVGGADTQGYISYFENCLKNTDEHGHPIIFEDHFEMFYKIICKTIRLFTDDYHIFFLICYGFIIFSFIYFANEFISSKTSTIPFALMIFVYWRGFNTFRTTLAVSFIMIALVMIKRNRKKTSVVFMIMSCLIHTASIVYVMFLPFYFYYKQKKIKLWNAVMVSCAVYGCIRYVQKLLLTKMRALITLIDTGAIGGYITHSLGKSIFTFNMISMEHVLLFAVMIIWRKKIMNSLTKRPREEQQRFRILLLICVFDFITIPVNFVLGIWRGYEYFYIPRLVMWGELIGMVKAKYVYCSRWTVIIFFALIFFSWLVFRIYNMWESSRLMPYVFELFV